MITECPMYRILMKLIGGGGICNCCVVYPENSCTDLRYSTKIPNKVLCFNIIPKLALALSITYVLTTTTYIRFMNNLFLNLGN